MGIVSNIIDALRRIGGPTVRTALRRQDTYLEGKEILQRGQTNITDPLGAAHALIATTASVPETVEILSEEAVRPLKENAQFGLAFLAAFGWEGEEWSLEDLDQAFAAWQSSADRSTYSVEYVIEVLGAMFGEYCCTHLEMRWIKLSDADGTTLAVDGVRTAFRGFPFQTISKRVADSEHGFFRPVFILLRHQSAEAQVRAV